MSVITCHAIGNRSGSHNSQYQKTYEVQYRLLTNDPLDGPGIVVNHSELPALYDSYEFGNDSDANVYLISKQPREESSDGSFKTWTVTCEYSNAPPVELTSNPISEPAKFSMSFDQFTTIARLDQDGRPITNTRSQAFTPSPEMDQSRPVYVVRRNELFINLPFVIDMVDSVNVSAWKGCAPRTVKCKSIVTGEIQQRNGISFYETTYEFHLYDQTWDLFILNQTTKAKNPFTGKVEQFPPGMEAVTIYTGAEGTTEGEIVAPGTTVTRDQVYVSKRVYKERNFNLFPF